ncbi:MAG: hypothetical protein KC643_03890, partial [Nitrospira sp.]|nr:hypothetical protein [Nitrospira sp.]
ETGMQQGYGPEGKPTNVEVPLTYHLKHRTFGKFLISVNGQLQSSNVPGMPWRLLKVPEDELQKAQYDPGNTRKGY